MIFYCPLCDNQIALDKLPLNQYEEAWKKSVVKKDFRARDDSVAITNFLKKEKSQLLFMEAKKWPNLGVKECLLFYLLDV